MPTIPKDVIKRRELSYKASKDALKTTGIMLTPVTAQTLYNIYNDNRTQTVISPEVQKYIEYTTTKKLEECPPDE